MLYIIYIFLQSIFTRYATRDRNGKSRCLKINRIQFHVESKDPDPTLKSPYFFFRQYFIINVFKQYLGYFDL